MKGSHYHTPRTMGECEFQEWGQAVFIEQKESHNGMWIALFIVFVMIGVILWK